MFEFLSRFWVHPVRSTPAGGVRSVRRRPRLQLEPLEDRTVPAVMMIPTLPVYAVLSDGRIVITGTSGEDSCSITYQSSDDTYQVKCNGVTKNFSASSVWRGEAVFWGRESNDTFVNWGAPLHVRAYGEGGDDLLIGGEEDDTLYGGQGHDELWGMGDNDTLYGEAGNDTLKGQDGTDWLEGGDNDDVLLGGKNSTSTEYLLGGRGNDYLAGEDGTDHLDGEDGTDTLDGGAGDDVLESKLADCDHDELWGRSGRDTFRYEHCYDILKDFNSADDTKV